MRIIESLYMTVTKQIRFPRSKKRRIKQKWARNPKNLLTEPDPNSLIIGDVIYCHPVVAAEIRLQFKKIEQNKPVYSSGINAYGKIGPVAPLFSFGGMSLNEL